MTPQGLPAGYELFPGNTYEGSTLVQALDALEKRHGDARFTVVADAAMISKENEAALQKRGTPYILGARLKSRPADEKEKILDLDGYRKWTFREHSESIGSFRVIELDGEREMVVTHSPKRARKDKNNRDKALEKLRKRIGKGEGPASFSSRGAGRFLKFPRGKVEIDHKSVKEDAKWDGLRGIVAWSCGEDDPRELVAQYRRLAEIEACFRTNKHDMKIRPIFHWKENRVRAHIAVCYMAFCCVQHLRVRLDRAGCRMSADRIRLALNEMEICIMREKSGGKLFAYPTTASDDAKKIYSLLGLKWIAQPFIYVPQKDRRRRRKNF